MPLEMRGRHAQDAPQVPQGWRCPACGDEQTGRLEDGCAACGAGKNAAKHVGVDPVVRKGETPPPASPEAAQAIRDACENAFDQWAKDRPDLASRGFARAIFRAGYEAAQAQIVTPTSTFSGTAETRTIVAALKLFKNQILSDPTELESGEWLAPEAIDQLIARLERSHA